MEEGVLFMLCDKPACWSAIECALRDCDRSECVPAFICDYAGARLVCDTRLDTSGL